VYASVVRAAARIHDDGSERWGLPVDPVDGPVGEGKPASASHLCSCKRLVGRVVITRSASLQSAVYDHGLGRAGEATRIVTRGAR
jgi:hypothetical protein